MVSEKIPHAHSVSIGIWVTTGSRHECDRTNGVAHFIEHLLFKGTEKRTSLDIAREIDSVGGILNAFTSREYICFYVKVLSEYLDKAVELLSDIFLNSLFDPNEIERERKVILQEIWMVKDNPDNYVHDLFHLNFWKNHPLGKSILGTEDSVGNLTREAIINYKEQRFTTGDIIVTAAGNVEHEKLVGLLNVLMNGVPRKDPLEDFQVPSYEKRVEAVNKNLEQIHLCLGTKALPQNHPLRYESFILNTVLGGSMSSRLFQEIRENKGLAYSVYSYISSHSDAGSLIVYAGTSRENMLEIIRIILDELRRLNTERIPEQELKHAKEHLKGNLLLSLESSDNRMTKLAKNEIFFGRNIPINEIIHGVEQVTAESLLQLSNKLFVEDYFTLQLIGNVGDMQINPSIISL
ncbi:MAG TPA: pitrilysin family protein [Geobacteraceae bacterium]|nr:pitrilysin family protein [Geobacteraceae bacterium]